MILKGLLSLPSEPIVAIPVTVFLGGQLSVGCVFDFDSASHTESEIETRFTVGEGRVVSVRKRHELPVVRLLGPSFVVFNNVISHVVSLTYYINTTIFNTSVVRYNIVLVHYQIK